MPTSPSLFQRESTPSAATTDWIAAHCDGGARGNPGPAGYGAVLTGSDGQSLAELSEFLGVRTNNFAEYSGLLACLQWALDHGHPNLRVVSDSELMVKQIQGKYKVKSPDLLPLWQEARRRIARLQRFEITHALRHKNKDADRLANQAMDRGMGRATAPGANPPPINPRPSAAQAAASATPVSKSASSAAREGGPTASRNPPARPPENNSRQAPVASAARPSMLRGFTRDGAIHVLGDAKLPDGIFVKIIPE